MPCGNGVACFRAGNNTASQAQVLNNPTTSRQLSESTQKLFDAINDENLEAFKQALAEGADVNAFDEEGVTPLMSIVNTCAVSGDGQATLEKMAGLLIQNSSIDVNAQSREYVYEERRKRDRCGRLVYLSRGREVVQTQSGYHVYCDDGRRVDGGDSMRLSETYGGVMEYVKTFEMREDTALHIACQVGVRDIVKILLTHPGVKTDVKNYKDKSPLGCIARGIGDTLEFEKAQKGKELLDALSSENIYRAKRLLNQELNPNRWKRNRNGKVETPLSLIIKSCLQGITQGNEEVLTELLKHKDLDFSQMKPIQAMEKNAWVEQIIEQAIKERLTDTINRKDLDDVKKLVEDNCFINRAIVTAALRGVDNPVNSIKDYLNEKFPVSAEQPVADAHNVQPEINDEFIARELQQLENLRDKPEKTEAQLAEKENELNSAKQERLSSENRLLRSNKNKKSSQAISSGRKLSNYASACFILLGVYTVVACLVIEDYPGMISAFFTAVALAFFLLGCCSLYGANTRLSDVESTQLGDLERS